ncbi:ATP-binding protein [Paenibacillus chungangensis]|uniref:histidine kinase n=1 Tax=Paenibacillus chungangensis TaxID=696535 RepID=A0ABW3HTF1_9BACL
MERISMRIVAWMIACLLLFSGATAYADSGDDQKETIAISQWKMLWEDPGQERTIEEVMQLNEEHWFDVMSDVYPAVPDDVSSAWLMIQLPELTDMRPAILFEKLHAQDVMMYLEGEVIFERYRDYAYNLNEFIVPVSTAEINKTIYIHLVKSGTKLGLYESISIGNFDRIFEKYIAVDLINLALGGALIIVSFFMLLCILFLKRAFLPGWNSLSIVMFCIGVMILSYSTLIEKVYPEYGYVSYYAFDISSTILIPAIFFFFERVIGKGPFRIITIFKWGQTFVGVLLFTLFLGSFFIESIQMIYNNLGMLIYGVVILLGNIALLGVLINQCLRGNRDAMILGVGFGIFIGVGIGEILWYFSSDRMHKMFFWKIALLFFLASLIIILVRKVMKNYEQAVIYSKQIEIFNNELQQAERIETISQLAASIAHEVRNPLQVTRGFLQLLGAKTDVAQQKYMHLAITELDRASEIITDFLTFAKPDVREDHHLNLGGEIRQIEAILAPLATLHGGSVKVDVVDEVYIRGNSSKFKQALINIIKNSIEAFKEEEEGVVEIRVRKKEENAEIIIIDNGKGIEQEDLKRLGEPYYSKKSKGTGLGLMVTFRIIAAMKGEMNFSSNLGKGTKVRIILPYAKTADE